MSYSVVELIERKRDGGRLADDEIGWLIGTFTEGKVADYQMSAMAMAIVFNGLDAVELAAWTEAMLHSGDVLDLSDVPMPKVDKHSTGGVGDKISIPLAPLVASCGVAVPMISGRALGHTGGTLDKLETIPGFTTDLDAAAFHRSLTAHGLVMAGQSNTLVPADRRLYALRDTSGTVPSIPLIASSIMSKKLAEGLDGLLLDVKTGSGAFMKTVEGSRELATTMVGIGLAHGVETVALITSMDQPLGREVGNANEMVESVAVLRGEGPDDVTELTLAFGEVMLELGGVEGGRARLQEAIDSGAALDKLIEIAIAQGGDPSVLEDTTLFPRAPHEAVLTAPRDGYVSRCDALTIGLAATRLGAGRERSDDAIQPGVGITIEAKMGDLVERGQPLARVSYLDEGRWHGEADHLAGAWQVSDEPPQTEELVLERVDRHRI